jgi:hypothetical protein
MCSIGSWFSCLTFSNISILLATFMPVLYKVLVFRPFLDTLCQLVSLTWPKWRNLLLLCLLVCSIVSWFTYLTYLDTSLLLATVMHVLYKILVFRPFLDTFCHLSSPTRLKWCTILLFSVDMLYRMLIHLPDILTVLSYWPPLCLFCTNFLSSDRFLIHNAIYQPDVADMI